MKSLHNGALYKLCAAYIHLKLYLRRTVGGCLNIKINEQLRDCSLHYYAKKQYMENFYIKSKKNNILLCYVIAEFVYKLSGLVDLMEYL